MTGFLSVCLLGLSHSKIIKIKCLSRRSYTSAIHLNANFNSATLSDSMLDVDIVTHRKLGLGGLLGSSKRLWGQWRKHTQAWVCCVGSACIIGEEWNVVTFTSLLSCHVEGRQDQNAAERLGPRFEFRQATQRNNGFSNWYGHLGSPVLNSWELRLKSLTFSPWVKMKKMNNQSSRVGAHFSFFIDEVCSLLVAQNRLQSVAQDDLLHNWSIFLYTTDTFEYFWITFQYIIYILNAQKCCNITEPIQFLIFVLF